MGAAAAADSPCMYGKSQPELYISLMDGVSLWSVELDSLQETDWEFVLKDNPLVYVFVFFFYELKLSQKSVWENIPLVLLTWSRLYNI